MPKKDVYASIGTILTLGAILLLLLWFKLMIPSPPIAEQGIEVGYGVDPDGEVGGSSGGQRGDLAGTPDGDFYAKQIEAPSFSERPAEAPKPQVSAAAASSSESSSDNTLTQDGDEVVSASSGGSGKGTADQADLERQRAAQEEILYLVPGSPFVAERTVQILRERAAQDGTDIEILPAMSFLEPLFAVLGVDPVHGLSIVDALDEDLVAEGPRQDMIVTQLYSREIASNVKLLLMEHLADTHEICYLHHLALPDARVVRIPLFELDWQDDIDHLTTLFIPYTPGFWEK